MKNVCYFKLSLFLSLIAFAQHIKGQSLSDLPSADPNKAGAGLIKFEDYPPLSDKPVNIWYYTPVDEPLDIPILFVCHGMNRNADDYRDNWIDLANQYQVMIIAPEFSREHYPKSLAYNLGNMFKSSGDSIPEERWSFSLIDPIFDFMVKKIKGHQTSYDMFGHSAGAQFAHRFMMFKKNSKVNRVVTANAGWYTMPDFSVNYPYGLNNTSLKLNKLLPVLQRKVVVLLGDADTTRSSSLRQTPEADQQGKNRYERGLKYFEMAQQLSKENSLNFGWQLQTVPGVGHNNAKMAPAAAQFLYGEQE